MGVDYEQAQLGLHAGELNEAVIAPAEDANGWVILLSGKDGRHSLYTGHSGTEKVFHSLDRATAVAREIGFESIRIEERF